VKTTPKPNATKNSKGEFVGPLLLLLFDPCELVAAGGPEGVVLEGADMTLAL